MKVEMIIEGVPVAKKRPRFARVGDHVKTYDVQSIDKAAIKCQMLRSIASQSFLRRLQGNISVRMTFHTLIPKSWSQKRSMAVLGKPDGRRPDLDNYVKMYADVMNKLIYEDDNQITELWCEKLYSDKPRVEIVLTEIEDN